jgi:hypothetical protein
MTNPAWISLPRNPDEIQPAALTEQKKTDSPWLCHVAADGRDMVEFRKTAGMNRRGQKAWE